MSGAQDISYFVINMAKDVSRWQNLQAVCPPGIHFTRFEAVDGRNVTESVASTIQDRGQLSAPELGCMLSHLGVWETIMQQDISLAVVMEDDVMFGDNFVARLQSFVTRLAHDFDIAYLSFNADMHVKFEIPGVGEFAMIADDGQYGLATTDTACYRLYRAWGTCAYVISRQGAARLLDLVRNRTYSERQYFNFTDGLGNVMSCSYPTSPIDLRILSLMRELQAYVAIPPICQPRPQVETTIIQRSWDH